MPKRYARAMLELLDQLADLLDPYVGVITALATVLTAAVAIVALGSTARDSRDRSRPLVFATFRMAEHSDSSFELVVRNYGTSAALNLIVEFDPPFTDEQRTEVRTDFVAKRYDDPIPLLPPNGELSNTWWSGGMPPLGGDELVNTLNTPDKVGVKVSYKGNRFRRYRDEFQLTADTMKLITSSVSSTSVPGRIGSIAASLKSIAIQTTATNKLVHDIGRRMVEQPRANSGGPSEPKRRRGFRGWFAITGRRRKRPDPKTEALCAARARA
jgi:hypothetical protein